MPPTDPAKQWAADVLRADERAMARLSSEPARPLLDGAEANGVLSLVDLALRQSHAEVPARLREELAARTRCDQSIELARRAELVPVLEALHRAGVRSLLLKGSAIAYTHYPFPHLRPRVDTDILVRPEDRLRAAEALEGLGYARDNAVDSEAIFTQSMFRKPGVGTVRHLLDLHWHISNRLLFRDLLSFDELHASAVGIPVLGPGARTPDAVHSLQARPGCSSPTPFPINSTCAPNTERPAGSASPRRILGGFPMRAFSWPARDGLCDLCNLSVLDA